jgi:DNA-binding NtrC family response regulator
MSALKESVLVVEDDTLTLGILDAGLRAHGFEVIRAESLSNSYLAILKSPPNIILADYQLDDSTAFDLLAWLKARDISIPLIVITAHGRIDLAVEAVKNGAESLIPKPVDLGYLITELRRTLDKFRNVRKDLAHKLERSRYERDPFLGKSPAIQELERASRRVANANSGVLIQGETGTGKGVLARWLHNMGPRSNQAFVNLNCAGISRDLLESEIFGYQKGAFTGAVCNKIGFLEAANHGTLFLDEIGDMDLQAQAKILKVVEEKRFYRLGDARERIVDVQVMVATHRNLKQLTKDGSFRSDLYYRISPLCLRIPPLRERIEDIPAITDRLMEQFSWDMKHGRLRISDNARLELERYSWPGNIRELRNVLERATLLCDGGVIHKTGLEFDPSERQSIAASGVVGNLTLKEMERRYIIQTLESAGGRVGQAAKCLGIPRSSLYAKIHEYAISTILMRDCDSDSSGRASRPQSVDSASLRTH